jgi:hypothetical protein
LSELTSLEGDLVPDALMADIAALLDLESEVREPQLADADRRAPSLAANLTKKPA